MSTTPAGYHPCIHDLGVCGGFCTDPDVEALRRAAADKDRNVAASDAQTGDRRTQSAD